MSAGNHGFLHGQTPLTTFFGIPSQFDGLALTLFRTYVYYTVARWPASLTDRFEVLRRAIRPLKNGLLSPVCFAQVAVVACDAGVTGIGAFGRTRGRHARLGEN